MVAALEAVDASMQKWGYSAFVPKPLPPDPPVHVDDELLELLSQADQAIGRLDAAVDALPDATLFVPMYVRKEAVLSSNIEGIHASLADVLESELTGTQSDDVAEVMNCVSAMDDGLESVERLPISSSLLREIHGRLMSGERGKLKSPGEFRMPQNWIGGTTSSVTNARFVPPPPHEVEPGIEDLEAYVNGESAAPALVEAGLIHSQFETIHPFLDGNDRVGRMLIALFLVKKRVLKQPILYLSAYFKQHQEEYYDRLLEVRTAGDWEGWLKFFLKGVQQVSQEADHSVRQVWRMRQQHRQEMGSEPDAALELLDHLYQRPYVTAPYVAEVLKVTRPTAQSLIDTLTRRGVLVETAERSGERVLRYEPYLRLFEESQPNK